MPPSVP